MPIFQYTGTNAEGKTERGFVPGDSMEAVAKRLESKGVKVEQIGLAQSDDPLTAPPPPQTPKGVAAAVSERVSLEELQFFFLQLGTLLNAGITVSDAMNTLSNQARSSRMRHILQEARGTTLEGASLGDAFARHPEVFSPLMMAMMRTGERGGFLAEQCKNMSEYLRKEIELRNLIKKETAYPKIVIVVSIVVIFVTNTVVEAVGREGSQKIWSPLTTPMNWIILGPVILLIWYYFKVVLKQPAAKFKWDKNVLTIPYIGPTCHGFAMAKFGRSFASLYKAGVPISESVHLAADSCGNEFVRAQIYPAAAALDSKEGITEAFAKTGAFSPMVLDMTRTGEVTGDIDQMLNKVSEYYEDEGAVRAKQAATILGVVVFLAVAAYVLIILFKFYSEYFSRSFGGEM